MWFEYMSQLCGFDILFHWSVNENGVISTSLRIVQSNVKIAQYEILNDVWIRRQVPKTIVY